MVELQKLINKFDTAGGKEAPPPVGKVLVIDDDPNIRQGLERTLRQKNYDVVISASGEDGVRCLEGDVGHGVRHALQPRQHEVGAEAENPGTAL